MRCWHHAPAHRLEEQGAYIVTGATYRKQHFFRSPAALTIVHDKLLEIAELHGWILQAWAVFSNHYHFIALSPPDPESLARLIKQLHWETAVALNEIDGSPHRTVWYNYWETLLTYERSYLARLNYVHSNAVKHGLCNEATGYPWCSARWFERSAAPSFQRTVKSFRYDRLNVLDGFEPVQIQ